MANASTELPPLQPPRIVKFRVLARYDDAGTQYAEICTVATLADAKHLQSRILHEPHFTFEQPRLAPLLYMRTWSRSRLISVEIREEIA